MTEIQFNSSGFDGVILLLMLMMVVVTGGWEGGGGVLTVMLRLRAVYV